MGYLPLICKYDGDFPIDKVSGEKMEDPEQNPQSYHHLYIIGRN